MKKLLLLLVTLVMMFPTMEAQRRESNKYSLDFEGLKSIQPIVFVENGIQFSVMPNGKFKFAKYRRNTMKYGTKNRWKKQRNAKVKRDHFGRIVRVDNVSIKYKRGKIDRIGTVDFKYRRGQLKQVGNLFIIHKRNGEIAYYGTVKKQWLRNYRHKLYLWS